MVLFPASHFPVTEMFLRLCWICFLEELFGGTEGRGKGEGAEDSGRTAGQGKVSVCDSERV